MKIAMIGQKGIPSRAGGIEIHVEELGRRLVKRGCNVDVYCRKGYCDQSDNDIGVNTIFAPYINTKHLDAISHTFFSTIKALTRRTDIFHYHALGPSTLAFIPRLFGKKVICTVHGLDWQRGKWGFGATRFLKFGEFATAKFSNETINVSCNLVDYYIRKYGKKTHYIPNGTVANNYRSPKIILEKYGLERDTYILFLARLVPEKGAHYLIEAYNGLKTEKKLVIAGGSSHSNKYFDELKKLAERSNKIIFTGFVKGEELLELYSNAYVYVLPSDIEGMPISLLEAMSFGNCCVTSDIAENTDVIGDYGYTFCKGNPVGLKNVLQELLNDQEKVFKVRNIVKEYIIHKYNWDNITEQTLRLYVKVLKREVPIC